MGNGGSASALKPLKRTTASPRTLPPSGPSEDDISKVTLKPVARRTTTARPLEQGPTDSPLCPRKPSDTQPCNMIQKRMCKKSCALANPSEPAVAAPIDAKPLEQGPTDSPLCPRKPSDTTPCNMIQKR